MRLELIRRVNVPQQIWQETEFCMRKCGAKHNECIVFWLSQQTDEPEISVAAVWHPKHLATAIGYDVPEDEIHRLHEYLYRERKAVIAQLHTHPGSAFHSPTDDHWPMIHSRGFLSIVVPFLCSNGFDRLAGFFVCRYLGDAQWEDISISNVRELFHFER